MEQRISTLHRKTAETDIEIKFNLDGTGHSDIHTGIGFFDHMLTSFCRHGFFNMALSVKGDREVDGHHTVEDTGIVLGQALKRALGNKVGIRRFGSFLLPMDDALIQCVLDLSGRPYLAYGLELTVLEVGTLETELIREFFYAVSYSGAMNIHLKQLDGRNHHHIIEAAFKAFGKALDEAVSYEARLQGVLSTKGVL